jgi:uncharacterized OB-fold protein
MSATPGLPAPAPPVTPELKEFWAATANDKLMLPKCDACSTIIWYPRNFCPGCSGRSVTWVEASGDGSVYTFTIVRTSAAAGYGEATPYVVAYVELDEGPRVMTNVIGCDPEQVTIGMKVRLCFHDTGEGSALYRFEPA